MRRLITQHVLRQISKHIVGRIRNTAVIESLHAGTEPSSATGDYTDVKVVTPYGEIPWLQLSRFNDDEMKVIMVTAVNLVFTTLMEMMNPDKRFVKIWSDHVCLARWWEPKINQQEQLFLDTATRRKSFQEGIDESTKLKTVAKQPTDESFLKVKATLEARAACQIAHANTEGS